MMTIKYKGKEYGINFSYDFINILCVEVFDLNGFEVLSDFELDITDIENLENYIIEDIERHK